jgi:hypothetical protein
MIWATEHWKDIVIALIFAVLVDFLGLGHRMREWIRLIQNKLAERSAAKLRKRLLELQLMRNNLDAMLTSDRELYMMTLRIMMSVLVLLSSGATLIAFFHTVFYKAILDDEEGGYAMGTILFSGALISSIVGLRMIGPFYRERMQVDLSKIDNEMAQLRLKLEARK